MSTLLTHIGDDEAALRIVMYFGQNPQTRVRRAILPRYTLCDPTEVETALTHLKACGVVHLENGAVRLNEQWQDAATHLAQTHRRVVTKQRLKRVRRAMEQRDRETIRQWLQYDSER